MTGIFTEADSNNVVIDTTTGAPIDILASDRQEGLPVHYKSPFSIGAGIEYKIFEGTLVHFAAEWFAPLSTYAAMEPESGDFILNNPTSVRPVNSAELLKVYDSMKGVFNLGIAVEHKLNDKITGYAAIRTDFSNANFEDIDGLFVGYTDLNIYHFTLGAATSMDDTTIGHGFEYSHGERSDFPQAFNMQFGRRGVLSLLLEGGSEVNAAMLKAKLVDHIRLYMAPLLLGGQNAKGVIGGKSPARLAGAIELRHVMTRSVGNDVVVEGDL